MPGPAGQGGRGRFRGHGSAVAPSALAWRCVDRSDPRHPGSGGADCGDGDWRPPVLPHVDLCLGDPSLGRGVPVLERCVRLGLVVEGAKPLRNKGDIGWSGGRTCATRYAGRSDELAEQVHAHGGEHH